MASNTQFPAMHFTVKNLGTVAQGELQIKPLTLLCGANNTGKTWVMYALYGFLRQAIFRPLNLNDIGLAEADRQLRENGLVTLELDAWLAQYQATIFQALSQSMQNRLPDIFNSHPALFQESRFDWESDTTLLLASAIARPLQLNLDLGNQGKAFLRIQKSANERTITMTLAGPALYDGQDLAATLLEHVLARENWKNVFLLPAERNGLHLFFRELRNQRAQAQSPKDVRYSVYAEPIAHYLAWLYNLGRLEATGVHALRKISQLVSGEDTAQAEVIEKIAEDVKNLAGGKYTVDADSNISFTPAGNATAPALDLHVTSSTVKSLFGLWYFLKHDARSGDILMIDEPELNLHPRNQRLLARILARLANAGVHVVCSTHSDYIVRELNSLMLLSRPHPAREALMEKYAISPCETLTMSDVAAYNFADNTFAPMRVNPDEGLIASTFDQVIRDLNDSSDDIYYTYRDQE